MSIWSAQFWKATAERAVSTAAQAALAGIGTDLVGVLDMDAVGILSLAGGGAILSVLKSVAATAATGGPSMGGGEALTDRRNTHRR